MIGATAPKSIDSMFDLLKKVAESIDPVARQRLVAALVYKGEIIAFGHNKKKTHPFAKRFCKHEEAIYLHAEVDCIKNALRDYDINVLKKSTMFVLRVKKPEKYKTPKFILGMAKPCEGCQRAIATFGIKNVYFTTDDGYDTL